MCLEVPRLWNNIKLQSRSPLAIFQGYLLAVVGWPFSHFSNCFQHTQDVSCCFNGMQCLLLSPALYYAGVTLLCHVCACNYCTAPSNSSHCKKCYFQVEGNTWNWMKSLTLSFQKDGIINPFQMLLWVVFELCYSVYPFRSKHHWPSLQSPKIVFSNLLQKKIPCQCLFHFCGRSVCVAAV